MLWPYWGNDAACEGPSSWLSPVGRFWQGQGWLMGGVPLRVSVWIHRERVYYGASPILVCYLARPPSGLSHDLVADPATPDGQAVVTRPAEKLKGQHQGLPSGFL